MQPDLSAVTNRNFSVTQRIEEIRAHVRRARAGAPAHSDAATEHSLSNLHKAFAQLDAVRETVGRMPGQPHSVRATIGAVLVRIVQRMLFWYTPQIRSFHNASVAALDHVRTLLEREVRVRESLAAEVGVLREQVSLLRGEALLASRPVAQPRTAGPAPSPTALDLDAFYFSLQDEFRGPEADVRRKLQPYLDAVRELAPGRSGFLDLGCGRGDWLRLAGEDGFEVMGIDTSPTAVARCRTAGLDAKLADALHYLRSLPDKSLTVITAFHVFEHLPFELTFEIVREASRVLRPAGLLIAETPDPGNLPMGTHHFWLDPTHRCPVPCRLLAYLFRSRGFSVARTLRVNPCPRETASLLDELAPIRELNECLHGPQDYGLVGRR